MAKVVIIGSGLTGLSLAHQLEKNNFFDYELYESDSIAGGLLKTASADGFTFDHTGHFLHISNNEFSDFLNEVLGLDKCNKIIRSSHIYSFGQYLGYPFQQNIGELPPEVAYECLEGFVLRKQKIKNPKNFFEWVEKFFGSGFGKHFFYPYNSKLLNIKPKDLMPSWTGRFVPQTTLRDLTNSLMGQRLGDKSGYNSTFFYPKTGGISRVISGIVASLKNKINLGSKLIGINKNTKQLTFENGKTDHYQKLVVTMPLPETLKIISGADVNFEAPIINLRCNSVFNFNLGINKPSISDKHWVYLPEKKFMIYRMGFWHNFSENMAPPNMSSIYGEYSFLNINQSLTKTRLISFEKAVDQTLDFLNLSKEDVVLRKDLLLKYAYVVYDSWREKNLSLLLNQLKNMNIYSIGRFGHWKYSSMQEAFLDGMDMAKIILDDNAK